MFLFFALVWLVEVLFYLVFSLCITHRLFYETDIWEQVLKRKHALDKGEAIMPVHGDTVKQCTSEFDVNCTLM